MISVRKADEADEYDVWAWRNDPVTRRMSRETAAVSRQDGQRWFAESLENRRRTMLILEDGRGKLGVVRFDEIGTEAFEISINLNPEWRGRGLCRPILQASIAHLRDERKVRLLTADIRQGNEASTRCFVVLGFVLRATANDFCHYELALPAA